jgi:hypothetical protein
VIWVRGPLWDGVWILSGVPLGTMLMGLTFLGLSQFTIIFWAVLLTQTGHLLSPLALAWSHDGFRQVMLQRVIKYVIIPIVTVCVTTLAAFASSFLYPVRFDPIAFGLIVDGPWYTPLQMIAAIYALWNAYHFGMQAFGVMSIYRTKHEHSLGAIASDGDKCRVQRCINRRVVDCPAGTADRCDRRLLCGSVRNIVGNLSARLSFGRRRTAALPRGNPPAKIQRKVDMVYCCGVTWAAMIYPFIPHLAKSSHNLFGWPVHPHPFLDRVWVVYTGTAIIGLTLMLWRERCLPRILFILTDGLGMIATPWFGLWGFAIVSMNHWLVAIGLASHTQRKYPPTLFALALMVAGMALFCLLFMNLRTGALYFTVTAVGFRLGCGFVHFLYDRWLYKFSDARVRATIGRDIFCLASASCEPSAPSS